MSWWKTKTRQAADAKTEALMGDLARKLIQSERDAANARTVIGDLTARCDKLAQLALERKQERDRSFMLRREQRVLLEGQTTKARLACKRMREELRHAQEKLATIQREGAGPAAPSNREPSGLLSPAPSSSDATWKALRLAEHSANHERAIARREMLEAKRHRAQADALRLKQELIAKALGVPFGSEPLYLVAEKLRKERDDAVRANAEFEQQFDLYHAAEMRGIKLWQAENPGRELTWPDKGKLTAWLLDRLDEAKTVEPRPKVKLPKRWHSCSSCGLTDEEEAEVRGYNRMLKECIDALQAAGIEFEGGDSRDV